ncbi:hypothetical protein HBI56_191670 [Parastagonospora nodorum]|uniref:Distal membrane-arm assembly complex protein 1-like domain-containing protein n=1 Tax=Phaeosphaeria nodorum (strain SN15 / ATCC MYA-4574 / FGSC 10173) TaxID=321614 RepID=A0A7U2IAD5_PHANO|nr:hypothetical protein HBH56_178670 [Parastagonospora nodorum]QRD06175.1 hypothetical protein JI435_309070 [Parastagonospora nodorum SN15]KAH3931871.1 hypothetical protein HBH54_091150 [Parastagonospora nodorum]KAH3939237.1 hypothetical protein HBH53_237220 [Parastagonospora nodorum]KAH3956849.1 hypothetical protein HBH51_234340 [Parastagonospora nodorum]
MSKEVTSPASSSSRPEFEDCTPCRVIGTATFVGLGAATYVSGHSQLREAEAAIRASKSMFGMRSRRVAVTSTASIMVGLGVYRWFS